MWIAGCWIAHYWVVGLLDCWMLNCWMLDCRYSSSFLYCMYRSGFFFNSSACQSDWSSAFSFRQTDKYALTGQDSTAEKMHLACNTPLFTSCWAVFLFRYSFAYGSPWQYRPFMPYTLLFSLVFSLFLFLYFSFIFP